MTSPILAIDLDGTLLAGAEIPQANIDALQEAVARDYTIAIATARWHQMASEVLERAEVPGFIIGCNGAHIYEPSSQRDLLDLRIDLELANAVMDRARAFGGLLTATFENDVVVFSDEPSTRVLPSYIQSVEGYPPLTGEAPRMMSYQAGNALDGNASLTSDIELTPVSALKAQLTMDDSIGPHGLPVTIISAKTASKGRALETLCEYLGRSTNDVIAFGDSRGDLDLFAAAGTSVAMGQAPSDVRDAADHVTTTNLEAGVAVFLRGLW